MPKKIFDEYNLRRYIFRVLKQVHPENGITEPAMNEMNFIMHHLAEKISDTARDLAADNNAQTISSRHIQGAVRLVLPGELAKHAVSEGTKAVTKYVSTPRGTRAARVAGTKRAGLIFSVSRADNLLRHHAGYRRVGDVSPVYLAGTLEYLCAELMELAGNSAKDNKRSAINTKDLANAVQNDEELLKLLDDVNLSGGRLPGVHPAILSRYRDTHKRGGD